MGIRESISFAEIGYLTGRSKEWGVRVATKGQHPSPGDEVGVRKANGEHKRVRLGGIVHRDQGAFPGPAVYYRILRQPSDDWQAARDRRYGRRSPAQQARAQQEQRLEQLRGMYRGLRDRLRELEAGWEQYEGYDGEYDQEMADLRAGMAEIERQGKALRRAVAA